MGGDQGDSAMLFTAVHSGRAKTAGQNWNTRGWNGHPRETVISSSLEVSRSDSEWPGLNALLTQLCAGDWIGTFHGLVQAIWTQCFQVFYKVSVSRVWGFCYILVNEKLLRDTNEAFESRFPIRFKMAVIKFLSWYVSCVIEPYVSLG